MTKSDAWAKSRFNQSCEVYCQYCNKLCKSINSLKQHECRCSANPNRKAATQLSDYIKAHRKGKTKYTCPEIAKQVDTMASKYASGYESPLKGQVGSFLGKKHTDKTKAIMSEKAKYNAINHINGWKSGDSHIQNKYEQFTEAYLTAHNISFVHEVNIPQSVFGKKGSYYQFDFLINEYIDLEIDGTSHATAHDMERDSYVSKLYTVYRIQHSDNLDKLRQELDKFILFINRDVS